MEAVMPVAASSNLAPDAGASARDAELAGLVPTRLRVDIIVRRQFFKHEEYYVLKDPLALTYFRLQAEEAYILSLLDGKRTLLEVARQVAARYPNNPRSLPDLAGFINQLTAGGLLNQNAGRFVENARRSPGQNLMGLWTKLVGSLLFFKIPLIDPSPWLGRLAHALRFVWTKWFVGAALVLFAWTFGLLLANLDAFTSNALDFFSAGNLALLWVTTIFIKTLHEFGHATTSRHFGGEVHEMGVCFMCFTPCGYVDASDAWMMRHKRHKLYVTIAGVFTELIIACVAAHLWLVLPDGLARGLAFNAMIVASINTLLFNANPLMRFDGYYLVCDLLEIPNLRSKAIAYCSYQLQRIFLGYRNHQQEQVFEQDSQGRIFVVYAVLAYLYMMFIIYSLTQIFARVLQPYGLHEFGLWLGFLVQGSFLMFPIIKVIADAIKPGAHIEKTGSTRRRVLGLVGFLALAVALSFFIPTRYYVSQQAVVMANAGEWVASEAGGTIREVHVRTGQWVEPGQLLVTLENPEVRAELVIQAAELTQARLLFGAVAGEAAWAAGEERARLAQGLEVAETAYARAAAHVGQLEVRSKVAGYVLTPDLGRMPGNYATSLHPLLRIADTRELRLVVPLTEDQAQLVEEGNHVDGRWQGTGRAFETRLDAISSQPAKKNEFHHGMLSYFGGPAPVQVLQQQDANFPVFLASAPLGRIANVPVEGLRVRVSISGRETTVAQRFGRWFLSLWKVHGSRS